MRFEPSNCPECGQQAKGTLETIPGIARLLFDEDGNAEYLGGTDVCWDGQETVRDESGRATLVCPDGHDGIKGTVWRAGSPDDPLPDLRTPLQDPAGWVGLVSHPPSPGWRAGDADLRRSLVSLLQSD